MGWKQPLTRSIVLGDAARCARNLRSTWKGRQPSRNFLRKTVTCSSSASANEKKQSTVPLPPRRSVSSGLIIVSLLSWSRNRRTGPRIRGTVSRFARRFERRTRISLRTPPIRRSPRLGLARASTGNSVRLASGDLAVNSRNRGTSVSTCFFDRATLGGNRDLGINNLLLLRQITRGSGERGLRSEQPSQGRS